MGMEDFSLYHVQILKNALGQRQKKNARYSLREFARNLGVSPTTLSQVFSQKKGLSEKTALSIAEKLNLELNEKEKFLLSVRSAHSRNSKVKLASSLELAEINKQTLRGRKKKLNPNEILEDGGRFSLESLEVQQLVARTDIHFTYRYSSKEDEMHFRILYILKDKFTGEVVQDFIQVTFNEKTRFAATVYFLKKENGRFKTYFNNTFDGKHKVTGLVVENQNTEILFDQDFLPTIPHIRFILLSANKHVIGRMEYTQTQFLVKGTLIDLDQPDRPLDPNYQFCLMRN